MKKTYFFIVVLFCCVGAWGQISITVFGNAYTENFNTLASTSTSSTVPAGWAFSESGSNANTTYTAGTGSSTTGDTYSFGSTASTERAFGGLRSGTLIPLFGANYINNTGSTITALNISYTGEEWRLGAAGRTDQLDFQYSTDATSLTTGTWIDVNALDFITPNTVTSGAHDGNASGNNTALSSTITGLSIPDGTTFWIRWNDLDVTGSDDGLGIDDFSITAPAQSPLPVKFSNLKAYQQGNSIKIDWSNLTESNVINYMVERSANGSGFTAINTVGAAKNDGGRADYSSLDASPLSGINFYRIRSNELDGKTIYSVIVKVNTKGGIAGIAIYPNPVTGGQVSLQSTGLNKGQYTVRIFNASGQQVYNQLLNHNDGAATEVIQLPAALKPGLYSLQLSGGDVTLEKSFIIR